MVRINNKIGMTGLVVGAILLPLFTAIACGGNSRSADKVQASEQPVQTVENATGLISLISPSDGQEVVAGTTVKISIQYTSKVTPDSVQIWFAGQPYLTLRPGELTATVDAGKTAATGVRAVKLLAFSGNKRPQAITMFLTILSDLEPIRYSHKVVKVFPHDAGAYTQGLIYHKGFFYEGTGQIGRAHV